MATLTDGDGARDPPAGPGVDAGAQRMCFGVLFVPPAKGSGRRPQPQPRVFPLGEFHRAGEALCGLLDARSADAIRPALLPPPDRVLRFPVFVRPRDSERRGRPNPCAHELANAFGLNADGWCPDGLRGPMIAVCSSEAMAWLLVDYCTAPESTRDSDEKYRRLFMFDAEAGLDAETLPDWE